MDIYLPKPKKKQDKKNKNRKYGRQYRYYGTLHSQTLYRSRNQRDKNKARRAAQRSRRMQRLKDKRDGIPIKDHRTGQAEDYAQGTGPTQR